MLKTPILREYKNNGTSDQDLIRTSIYNVT